MFERYKRARNQDGTFKKDVWWTPWSDSWEYKMSEDLKDMLERTLWTFIEAFLGALVVAPLVSSVIGSLVDTFLFFSIAFYATDIPWVSLAFGDLVVKLLIALVMLIPFRMLINKIKDFSDSSVSEIKISE